MRRHTFKLLILLTAIVVSPAVASRHLPAARHGNGCPHETARAAAVVSRGGTVPQAPVKITLTDRIPSGGGFFGGMPHFFMP
jgi:hypothetical protein